VNTPIVEFVQIIGRWHVLCGNEAQQVLPAEHVYLDSFKCRFEPLSIPAVLLSVIPRDTAFNLAADRVAIERIVEDAGADLRLGREDGEAHAGEIGRVAIRTPEHLGDASDGPGSLVVVWSVRDAG